MKREHALLGAVALAIGLTTVLLHWPSVRNGVVMWDDILYLETAAARQTVSPATVAWAFSTSGHDYYQPLTWLSHVIDHQAFGTDYRGHHAGNVLWHGANAVLVVLTVWLVLVATGRFSSTERWAVAAGVGLIFGIHPLQVESVAWIAERKNLLCGFFSLASLSAYLWYAQRTGDRRRFWTMILLAAGALLSKPMAVSLPVVMLALDFYPLRRHTQEGWGRLVREKLLLIVMAVAFSLATFLSASEAGAVRALTDFGLLDRVLIAVRGVIFYVWKLLWPVWLSPLYVLGAWIEITAREFYLPVALFAGFTALALLTRQRAPALLAGWAAFLAWVVPVSGLIQAGGQAAADRYMYLAMLPLVLLIGFGCVWFYRRASWVGRSALFVLLGCELLFLGWRTCAQIPVWRNEETLFRKVLEYYPQSGIANLHVARTLLQQRRFAEALPHAQRAAQTLEDDGYADAILGLACLKSRHYAEAVPALQEVLRQQPEFWSSRYNLACALTRLHRFEEALTALEELLPRQPQFAPLAARDGEFAALRAHPHYGERFRALLTAAGYIPAGGAS